MSEHGSAAPRRARLSRNAGRALFLTGFGAGVWLLGSHGSTAAAEEALPLPGVDGVLSSVSEQVLTPVVDEVVVPAVHDVVAPAVTQVAVPVVQDVAVPVVREVAVPVVEQLVAPAVTHVVVPVVEDVAVPVVEDVVVPVVDVVTPVVEDVVPPVVPPFVPPFVDDAVAPALEDVVAPVVQPGIATPAATSASGLALALPEVAVLEPVITDALPQAADPVRSAATPVTVASGELVSPAATTTSTPEHTLPVGPVGVSGTVPAPSTASGSGSADQVPADLASTALTAGVSALRRADGADLGVSSTGPYDPSFSPD